MENNKSNSVMNIEQLVPEIQKYLSESSTPDYKTSQDKLKKYTKTVKPRKRLKKLYPAAFSANLNQFAKKEIVFASSINPTVIELKEALISPSQELLNALNTPLKAFFSNFEHNRTNASTTSPYHDTYYDHEENITDFDVVHPDDSLYQYIPDQLKLLQQYSAENKNQLFFYKGNLVLNGLIYASYTSHLENLAKINILKTQLEDCKKQLNDYKEESNKGLEELTKAVEELQLNSIQRSKQLTDSDLQYLWTGTEEELQKINRDNQTIYFTAEDDD